MAKKKSKITNGIGLERPHPKQAPDGVICCVRSGYGVSPDVLRKTVLLDAGGVLMEMMPEKAREFAARINSAADWAERSAASASGD